MFVPKLDDGVPARQMGLAEIDRLVSERLGPARVAGNAQPAAFNRQIAMYLANRMGGWSVSKDRQVLQRTAPHDRVPRNPAD